mgnify:CR=1 FL=1
MYLEKALRGQKKRVASIHPFMVPIKERQEETERTLALTLALYLEVPLNTQKQGKKDRQTDRRRLRIFPFFLLPSLFFFSLCLSVSLSLSLSLSLCLCLCLPHLSSSLHESDLHLCFVLCHNSICGIL